MRQMNAWLGFRQSGLHVQSCRYWAEMDVLAGEEGFEPSNAGIKIRCLNQLGDSPTRRLCN